MKVEYVDAFPDGVSYVVPVASAQDEKIVTEAILFPVVDHGLMRNHDVMLGDCCIAHPSNKAFQFVMLVVGLFPSTPICPVYAMTK